jgi:tetratricopeptide (TPR) repeat protein
MRKKILATVACLVGLSLPAWPAGGGGGGGSGGGPTPQELDPDYRAGQTHVKAEQWAEALPPLQAAIRTDPKNADAWNLLGFAYRHLGDMDNSFKHYERALQLNPGHRDAHEYVGEAYLQVGQLEGAEKHLKALDKLCWFPCEQYTELKEKIAKFKRSRAGE